MIDSLTVLALPGAQAMKNQVHSRYTSRDAFSSAHFYVLYTCTLPFWSSSHNFANFTFRFCIPLSIASLRSSVCSIAAFHTAV